MSKSRKVWGEGFVLGLLVGVAALACLAGRPAARSNTPTAVGTSPVRLTRKPRREIDAARHLADLPTPSSAIH